MVASDSKRPVIWALSCNALLTGAKLFAFVLTGSGALLSEAIHSFADSLNQLLLLIGVVRSSRQADARFSYGYGAERYVWALISAVGIFFLGCGVTVYHGIASLLSGRHPEGDLGWAIGVLLLSLALEGAVLTIAVRSVKKSAAGRPFFNYLRTEADLSVAAVVLEDFAACVGVLIALSAVMLTRITGHAYWDAFGSILVGLLLGIVAIWLIIRNHSLLVGPSIPTRIRQQVLEILESNPSVQEVTELRSRVLDSETYRIAAELRFDGAALADKLAPSLEARYREIASLDDFRNFASRYADEIIELLGDEIDAIEKRIRAEIPKARYLDLEAE